MKKKKKRKKQTWKDVDTAEFAQETSHPLNPKVVESPTYFVTEHGINNRNVNNRNENRKIGTEKDANKLNTTRKFDAAMKTRINDRWEKHTVLIVGDSMLNNIDP